jgi:hypothetical protein
MRTKLAVTMVVVGLLCIPGLANAKGGGFVGMIQKPFQQAAAKVQALRQSWKEQRIVNKNIRALRRASPELNAAYKTAHRASRKQNSSLLAWSAGMAMLGTANAMWASGHYAAGDPVFGTVAAAGSACGFWSSAGSLTAYVKGAKLAGQKAVMEKLLTTDGLRQRLGASLQPATIKVVRGRIAQNEAAVQDQISKAQQQVAQQREKSAFNAKLLGALDGLTR